MANKVKKLQMWSRGGHRYKEKFCYFHLRHLTKNDKGITIMIQRKETSKSLLL